MKRLIFFSISIILILFLIIFLGFKKNISEYVEYENYYSYKNVSYGNHKRNEMDLIIPKSKTNGIILYIHGGYWLSGDKDGYYDSLVSWATNQGFAACAINYRYTLSVYNYVDILKDINNALAKAKELGKINNQDLTKVLLTGHSAGGHLSLLYSYLYKDSSPITPACVVNLSGPTDLTDYNYYKGKGNIVITTTFSLLTKRLITFSNHLRKQDILLKASPISYINEYSVPTITAHGVKDSVVPYSNAVTLHEILNQKNVENLLIPFPNSDHGLESDPDCTELLNTKMFEFADKYLK